jgi:hypothetical protein
MSGSLAPAISPLNIFLVVENDFHKGSCFDAIPQAVEAAQGVLMLRGPESCHTQGRAWAKCDEMDVMC